MLSPHWIAESEKRNGKVTLFMNKYVESQLRLMLVCNPSKTTLTHQIHMYLTVTR